MSTIEFICGSSNAYAERNRHKNEEIVIARMAMYNRITEPRVGDYLLLPNGETTRFTHNWGDHLQTGGGQSSFYLGNGYISYSGSLNPGIKREHIELTKETMQGHVWFFSGDWSGAGRGVTYSVPFRCWKIKENTPESELSGLYLNLNSK